MHQRIMGLSFFKRQGSYKYSLSNPSVFYSNFRLAALFQINDGLGAVSAGTLRGCGVRSIIDIIVTKTRSLY
jgi:hypothetical protein